MADTQHTAAGDDQFDVLRRTAVASMNISGVSIRTMGDKNVIEVKTGCCGIDPTTGKGKQLHLLQMLLLPFVPIMALITQNAINMVTVLESKAAMYSTINQVELSTALGNVTEALQSERAEIAFYLFTNGSVIRRSLSDHFSFTNELIDNLKWPRFRIDDGLFNHKLLFQIRLDDFRDKIRKFDMPSIDAGIAFYNKANYIFLDQLTREIKVEKSSSVWRPLLAYKNMIRAIEHLGISMVFGEQYFGRGELDQDSYVQFVTNDALGQDFLNSSQNLAFWVKKSYLGLRRSYVWYSNITRRRSEILLREKIQPDFIKATEYFEAMLGYLDALKTIQYSIRSEVASTLAKEVKSLDYEVVIGLVLLVAVLIISPVTLFLVRMLTKTLQVFSETLMEKTHELNCEKRRSDQLLYQMIPTVWAGKLRLSQTVGIEIHESVTVFFGELLNFYTIMAESTPLQNLSARAGGIYADIDILADRVPHKIISMLNYVYNVYGTLIANYDVYNVDMLGGAFMMVSGLHCRYEETNHSEEVSHMALDFMQEADSLDLPHVPGTKLKIRAGMHSAGVVAGVVGNNTPRFCIYGEAVVIAGALENKGEPHKVLISNGTKQLLDSQFILVARGEYKVHPKHPPMETFWLMGRHNKPQERQVNRCEESEKTAYKTTSLCDTVKKRLLCN